MSHPSLQDFFRPDLGASNRALKKYLEEEGLSLGFRDLVSLRGAAESSIIFSYAFLESWSAGEFSSSAVTQLVESRARLEDLASEHGWSWYPTPELLLVGLEGELESREPSQESSLESGMAMVPLKTVYGSESLLHSPGAGGVWKEEELQQASLTLLDGESEQRLVEAFRHLFRAAPSGAARAAVVATALSRHRSELNREVADKLEEISPPLGKALRQLFLFPETEGRAALNFLLGSEAGAEQPGWVGFWSGIRGTVLESLVRGESGRQLLTENLKALEAVNRVSERSVLTPRLVDALLSDHETLSPEGRSSLMNLLASFVRQETSAAEEMLLSRLELSSDIGERILLGEILRRVFSAPGREHELDALCRRFAGEALSVGSTAGSMALGELLGAFGPRVLNTPALSRLDQLSERQTLNATAMWEQLASDRPEMHPRVAELFISALRSAEEHWGLLLKSPLLGQERVREAFAEWCQGLTVEQRRKLVLVGQNWGLTAENRPLVAEAVAHLEWGQLELWESEWRRTTLSFQKLSWLAQCSQADPPDVSPSVEARVLELLSRPRRNLYLWDLLQRLAQFPTLGPGVRAVIVKVAASLSRSLEAGLEDEKEALLKAASHALSRSTDPESVLFEWTKVLKTGSAEELAWTFGLIQKVFEIPDSPFVPERMFVSALLQRLFQSGPDSMQQALKAALDESQEGHQLPILLSLEVQNLGLEALAAVAAHPGCPAGLRSAVQRRLTLFLEQWGQDLARTEDIYSFRSTPLFTLLEPLLDSDDESLRALLDQVVRSFLLLQRHHSERFRLEVRQSAQSFFARWLEGKEESQEPEVLAWRRVLSDLRG